MRRITTEQLAQGMVDIDQYPLPVHQPKRHRGRGVQGFELHFATVQGTDGRCHVAVDAAIADQAAPLIEQRNPAGLQHYKTAIGTQVAIDQPGERPLLGDDAGEDRTDPRRLFGRHEIEGCLAQHLARRVTEHLPAVLGAEGVAALAIDFPEPVGVVRDDFPQTKDFLFLGERLGYGSVGHGRRLRRTTRQLQNATLLDRSPRGQIRRNLAELPCAGRPAGESG